MRKISAVVLMLLMASVAFAGEIPVAPKGDDEFRAGWLALVAPMTAKEKAAGLQARQEARLAALPHFEAAVKADPENVSYKTSLSYAYLAAGKYQLAKDALDQAISQNKRDPLLYLLRGQAEAALMDPETSSAAVEKVLRSFEEAAHLDQANSLALLQASSVAFDAGREDLGFKKLNQAMERPTMTLYRLPIPEDLNTDRSTALIQWQYLQFTQWNDLIARGGNVIRVLLKQGGAKQEAGNLEGARNSYLQALEVAKRIGNTHPNLVITVNTAMNAIEDSYVRLLDVAKKTNDSKEAERWEGELGVLQIGRTELGAVLQGYMKHVDENPPASVEAMLALQGESLSRVMLGIGLTPTKVSPTVFPR